MGKITITINKKALNQAFGQAGCRIRAFTREVRRDIDAICDRDPAVKSRAEAALLYSGFHALLASVSYTHLDVYKRQALLGLRDKTGIDALAQRIVARNLSVRETEAAVKAQNKRPAPVKKEGVQVNYVSDLEHKVTGLTGRWCRISPKGARKTISIEYTDENDLESLLEIVCGKKITEE